MLIILFAAIIIFLSAKSRFNRAHMEGSSTNYGGGCSGGGRGRGPARGGGAAAGGARAAGAAGGSAGGEGRARVAGARAQTQQLITSNSPTVTKSPARNKNLIC